jgi:hypothetical protein
MGGWRFFSKLLLAHRGQVLLLLQGGCPKHLIWFEIIRH